MRLLNIHTLEFEEFHCNAQRYVVASHRWNADDEAMLADVKNRRNTDKSGYKKVEGLAKYVREQIGSVKYLWIDTCCVNQDSSQEVTEAVNSMFRWYSHAEVCVAYLAAVRNAKDDQEFRRSVWFRRGWTLQELLAPYVVVFLSQDWEIIGHKGGGGRMQNGIEVSRGPSLEPVIATITGVPEGVLRNYHRSKAFSVDERLCWIAGRETTRVEDMSYSLLGIFNVTMPVIYGEGADKARQRLLGEINRPAQQAHQFRKIVDWLSPPDPWTNHASARERYERQTGIWLLQSDQYRNWKAGDINHLWLCGKAGCGKTVLCSTLIEDVRVHCDSLTNTAYAAFYFSFSDTHKQSYQDLLRSLVAQLGWKEPSLSMLLQAYEKPNRSLPGLDDLEKILLASVDTYDNVFFLLDALDECPEDGEVRQTLLERLERLSQRTPNLRILATSREVLDVRASMEVLKAESMHIATRSVDADIQQYVSSQVSRDFQLCRLDPATKIVIKESISEKADGMFRWAYCSLQELKKSKSTKPSKIRATLLSLPPTLDEFYKRMLTGIDESNRNEALTLLRWLVYARSPPSLGELVEASIIDLTGDGTVDTDDRGGLADTLDILSGLVTIDEIEENNKRKRKYSEFEAPDSDNSNNIVANSGQRLERDTKVRLAHFSVKEYLESDRILKSNAEGFYLESAKEHRFLAQSCLTYILHYSSSIGKTSTQQDLVTFPLLQYAACSWFYHSSLQQEGEMSREIALLSSDSATHNWLLIHQPDQPWEGAFQALKHTGSGLYYASFLGLEAVVTKLLRSGSDVNAQEGHYGSALHAASSGGHEKVVKMLMDAGADVNGQGGYNSSALQAASSRGHEKVVKMLIDAGADVNGQGGYNSSALQAASSRGYEKVVKMLIDAGADVNGQGVFYGSVLQAASSRGHEKVVKMLIDAGADVNGQGGYNSSVLQAASSRGYEKVVKMLIDAGADVNGQGGYNSSALQAASSRGHEKVVKMLIDAGADVNGQGGYNSSVLQAASSGGHEKVVKMLIDAGADVNGQGGFDSNALQAASSRGHEKVVKMLMDASAILRNK